MSNLHFRTSPSWRSSPVWTCLTLCVPRHQIPLALQWLYGHVPWDCGEHPDLGRSHNLLGDHLRTVHISGEVSPPLSPPPIEYPMPELISRQSDRNTPEVVREMFTHMSERAYGTVFEGEPSWVYSLPRVKRCSRDGHLSTSLLIDGHPDRRQHRDRLSVVLTAADNVEADAIPVLPSKRPPLPD